MIGEFLVESVKSTDECMGWVIRFVGGCEMAKNKGIVSMKQVVRTEVLVV